MEHMIFGRYHTQRQVYQLSPILIGCYSQTCFDSHWHLKVNAPASDDHDMFRFVDFREDYVITVLFLHEIDQSSFRNDGPPLVGRIHLDLFETVLLYFVWNGKLSTLHLWNTPFPGLATVSSTVLQTTAWQFRYRCPFTYAVWSSKREPS
ncbi:hypothetical protein BD410DRAFT_496892 [Rickenella mellea]|uniref:Uncharacterized protein n=1 Tax=Rickenella mellea TaxID=50990 RepID=A0A4Y7PTY5_9AGAM|nr:hypothetical protein BD410DRAFT_496892 [Rickenella mellea]